MDHSGSSKLDTPKTQTAGSTLGEHKIKICMYDLPDATVTATTTGVWEECVPPSQSSTPSGRKLAGLSRRLSESDQKTEYKPSFAWLLFDNVEMCIWYIYIYTYISTPPQKKRLDGVRWRGMWSPLSTVVMFHFHESWLKETSFLLIGCYIAKGSRFMEISCVKPAWSSNLLDIFCSMWELHQVWTLYSDIDIAYIYICLYKYIV